MSPRLALRLLYPETTMNTHNILPLRKLALLAAAFCTVTFAFNHNATATRHVLPPSISLTIGDGHELGTSKPGTAGDANRTAIVNFMIGMALGDTQTVLGETIHRSNHDFGTLPSPAVIGPQGGPTDTTINIGSGLYSYLWAKYDGPNFYAEVWYIGDLSGTITIPATGGKYGLSGWTLFGPGVPGVPDGGTTVMLLGAALGALGMVRRFLMG
jgi:hypothetical protein